MEDFSALLERYRKNANLSQSELARKAGISASYVNRLEKSERQPPSRDIILQIAKALGLDPIATDTLLLAGDYAPAKSAMLPVEHPVLGLMADILRDDSVPQEEIEILERQIRLIKRRWHRSAQNPSAQE